MPMDHPTVRRDLAKVRSQGCNHKARQKDVPPVQRIMTPLTQAKARRQFDRWMQDPSDVHATVGSSSLSRRLVEAREALRWTQDDLARAAGMQCTAISHFETDNRTPSLSNFVKLAKALRVSADWLLGLSDDVKGVEVIVNGDLYVRSPNTASARES